MKNRQTTINATIMAEESVRAVPASRFNEHIPALARRGRTQREVSVRRGLATICRPTGRVARSNALIAPVSISMVSKADIVPVIAVRVINLASRVAIVRATTMMAKAVINLVSRAAIARTTTMMAKAVINLVSRALIVHASTTMVKEVINPVSRVVIVHVTTTMVKEVINLVSKVATIGVATAIGVNSSMAATTIVAAIVSVQLITIPMPSIA